MSVEETPKAMNQLILAYMVARQDSNINPLILIPCVILDFLCIHPFDDGNGRMSRLLSLLLMYKSDYDFGNTGRLEHEGKIYILADSAEPTSRALEFEGQFEMSAPVKDLQGNRYEVYWIFDDNGEETFENYDYSIVNRILEI